MKTLIVLYTVSGTALFIYLYLKVLRRALRDADIPWWDIIRQNLEIHRKMRTGIFYDFAFVGLLLGLFIFAATIVFLLQHFVWGQE